MCWRAGGRAMHVLVDYGCATPHIAALNSGQTFGRQTGCGLRALAAPRLAVPTCRLCLRACVCVRARALARTRTRRQTYARRRCSCRRRRRRRRQTQKRKSQNAIALLVPGPRSPATSQRKARCLRVYVCVPVSSASASGGCRRTIRLPSPCVGVTWAGVGGLWPGAMRQGQSPSPVVLLS